MNNIVKIVSEKAKRESKTRHTTLLKGTLFPNAAQNSALFKVLKSIRCWV